MTMLRTVERRGDPEEEFRVLFERLGRIGRKGPIGLEKDECGCWWAYQRRMAASTSTIAAIGATART